MGAMMQGPHPAPCEFCTGGFSAACCYPLCRCACSVVLFVSIRSLRVAVADSRWEFLNAAHLTYSEPEFLKF